MHKAILAHNFTFAKIIQENSNIHQLPFLIDAIFKEDIDSENKATILNFVNKHKSIDTQTIISIAYKDDETSSIIDEYKKNNFGNKANLICIGDAVKTQAFLSDFNTTLQEILDNTFNIIDTL